MRSVSRRIALTEYLYLRETDPCESLCACCKTSRWVDARGCGRRAWRIEWEIDGLRPVGRVRARARASAIDLLESVVLAMYTGCTCNRPFARSPPPLPPHPRSPADRPRPCYYVYSSRTYATFPAACVRCKGRLALFDRNESAEFALTNANREQHELLRRITAVSMREIRLADIDAD